VLDATMLRHMRRSLLVGIVLVSCGCSRTVDPTPTPAAATSASPAVSASAAKPLATAPAKPPEVRVEVFHGGAMVPLDVGTQKKLVAYVELAMAGCTFSSLKPGPAFGGGEDFDAMYKARAEGPHLLVAYATPHVFATNAGEVRATELLLALDTTLGPEPAIVKDGERTFGLKKCGYDDRTLPCHVPGLAKVLPTPSACHPAAVK
jgi:hypothetical protein